MREPIKPVPAPLEGPSCNGGWVVVEATWILGLSWTLRQEKSHLVGPHLWVNIS